MKMSEGELKKYKLKRVRSSDSWGFKITTCSNKTFITDVFDGTPAGNAGLGLNEIIVSINKVPCGMLCLLKFISASYFSFHFLFI